MCLPVATVSPSSFRLTRHSIHANVFPIFTTSHVTVTRSPNLAGAQYEQLRSVLTPPRVVIVNSATVVSTSTSVATHPPCNVPNRLVSSDVTSSSHSNAPSLGNLGREHRRRGAASYVPAATASRRNSSARSGVKALVAFVVVVVIIRRAGHCGRGHRDATRGDARNDARDRGNDERTVVDRADARARRGDVRHARGVVREG